MTTKTKFVNIVIDVRKQLNTKSITHAGIAQLIERRLAKAKVAGLSPVSRSIFYLKLNMAPWPSGKARVCKTHILSSILSGASRLRKVR